MQAAAKPRICCVARGLLAVCLLSACGGLEPSEESTRRGQSGGEPNESVAGGDGPSAAEEVDAGPPPDIGVDSIFGRDVERGRSWWVEGGRIHRADEEVVLNGINWFGLDASARALYGPANARRSVADFLAQLKSLGFNALRVPLSPESINPGFASESWTNRGAIDTGREHFEALLAEAKRAGMYLLLDVHTCGSAVGHEKNGPADPRCTGYGVDPWLADLATLAELAKDYAPWVLGIDLFNEPYGLQYPEWAELAARGGRVVLEHNPNILLFVEGVGNAGYRGTYGVFWGENLSDVRTQPIDLPASRLVYSPHVYGPSVFDQPYFGTSDFPDNMPAVWDEHFGFLFDGEHAVVPGEFGGHYDGPDKVWQDAFVGYLLAKESRSAFYWCLNPNSGDTGGLLESDWRTVNEDKLALLQRLME